MESDAVNDARLRDKFVGSLLGTMVGDALGAPMEGWDCEQLGTMLDGVALLSPADRALHYAVYGAILGGDIPQDISRYTDDTQMTLGVAQSLVTCRGFDAADMARQFAENFDDARGYGFGARIVLKRLREGTPWESAAHGLFGGMGSFGNGAAMRVAPVGLLYHEADRAADLRRVAEGQALITHTHPMGKEGAFLQAAAVAAATRASTDEDFDPYRFIDDLKSLLRDDLGEYLTSCDAILSLLFDQPSAPEVADILGNGVESYLSVPSAIYAFLAHHDSFAEAVLFAIRLGGDTDTIGAMCGALAGAFHGASGIPPNWLGALENGWQGRDFARELGASLYETWQGRRNAAVDAALVSMEH